MFTLEQITTEDGLIHQGILAEPKKSNGKAIIWIHGLTSTFYSNIALLNFLAAEAVNQGIAFASFNNRGHDMITGMKKVDAKNPKGFTYVNAGSGYEAFTECIFDIDAAISFLKKKSYTEIYLIGHSTGAQKVCYYASMNDPSELAGVILASPISDRLASWRRRKSKNYRTNERQGCRRERG